MRLMGWGGNEGRVQHRGVEEQTERVEGAAFSLNRRCAISASVEERCCKGARKARRRGLAGAGLRFHVPRPPRRRSLVSSESYSSAYEAAYLAAHSSCPTMDKDAHVRPRLPTLVKVPPCPAHTEGRGWHKEEGEARAAPAFHLEPHRAARLKKSVLMVLWFVLCLCFSLSYTDTAGEC